MKEPQMQQSALAQVIRRIIAAIAAFFGGAPAPPSPKDNMRAWINALRSGEYKQAKHALRRGDKFCCLGVACDVSKLGSWKRVKKGRHLYVVGVEEEKSALPEPVAAFFGVEPNPLLDLGNGRSLSAISANDHQDKTFLEIADALERTYL